MLFVANWKMAMTSLDAAHFFTDAKTIMSHVNIAPQAEVVIAPSFPYLSEVEHWMNRLKHGWVLGAQDVSGSTDSSSTGEVSGAMLSELGCKYVIVGHSERKFNQNEDAYMISQKIRASLDCGLTPILCVGESLHENQEGKGLDVILNQLRSSLPESIGENEHIYIAYEPVWAVGSGMHVLPEDAQNVLEVIDEWLRDRYSLKGNNLKLMYGGSVSSANAASFVCQPNIDGLLIGTASLQAVSLIEILRICTQSLSQST